ncbi:MAG: BamA/TamA family outer membrane protein, partial [Pseudomonadota bacterium]
GAIERAARDGEASRAQPMRLLRWAVIWAVLLAGAASAQPTPRVIEAIDVVGNERFSKADAIATSGLRPGDMVGEDELLAAVEALEFTGEFRSVRITTEGARLRIAVEEEPTFSGGLSFGGGFDTEDGVLGFGSLTLRDALIEGSVLTSRIAVAEEFRRASADVAYPLPVGPTDGIGLRLSLAQIDEDDASFEFDRYEITPYATFELGERSQLELRYTFSETDIGDLAADVSPILAAEIGAETSSGFGLTFRTAGEAGPVAWRFRLDQDFTGVGGDTALSTTEASLSARADLGQTGFALRGKLAGGLVEGLGGDDPRASDRFALGGASLRGFEGGTVSPRDVTATSSTILGGDRFAALQTELLVPVFRKWPIVETFVFGDIGSVWGLDTDAEAAGSLDTSFVSRRSAGVGASVDTALGRFEAYYAIGVDAIAEDDEERFGLTFRTRF